MKTDRLEIRFLRSSDYKVWKAAHSSMLTEQNKWDQKNKVPQDLTLKKFKKLLQEEKLQRKNETYIDYAVFRLDTKELIGRMGLMNVIRSVTQSAFLGYRIFNRHWGQGYAYEALLAVLTLAFEQHRLHRLQAGIEPDNLRSIKLAQKLGMRREGLSKNIVYLRSEWQDLVQYAITCEEVGIPWDLVPTYRD